MEWEKVKTINDCYEEATVDAYNEQELAGGWHACIEQIFDNVREVKLLGEPAKLLKFDISNNAVVAVCEKNKKRVKVTLDSLELIKPTQAQKLWLNAYIKLGSN